MDNFMKILGLGLISMLISTDAALADAFAVPEPSSMSLFAIGGISLVLVARLLKYRKSYPEAG